MILLNQKKAFWSMPSTIKRKKGFTLIELMIVVAIIGILAAIAVANFISYRNKVRVATGVATTESIRASVASFAANSVGNLFPADAAITDWNSLVLVCNNNGANLQATDVLQGLSLLTYDSFDSDSDSGDDNYYFIFEVLGVPNDITGKIIEVRPSGILRQTK